MIKAKEVGIVKEVMRSDGFCCFACGDVLFVCLSCVNCPDLNCSDLERMLWGGLSIKKIAFMYISAQWHLLNKLIV